MANVQTFSSYATIMVVLESNSLNLQGKISAEDYQRIKESITKLKSSKQDLNPQELEIMNSAIQRVPFEREVAQLRQQVREHSDTNHLRASFNETRVHIINLQAEKKVNPSATKELLTKANTLDSELSLFEEEFSKAFAEFIELRNRRIALKQVTKPAELAAVETKLKENVIPKLKRLLDKEKTLQVRVDELHRETTTQALVGGIKIPPQSITLQKS